MSDGEDIKALQTRVEALTNRLDYALIFNLRLVGQIKRLLALNQLNKTYKVGGKTVNVEAALDVIWEKLDKMIDESIADPDTMHNDP